MPRKFDPQAPYRMSVHKLGPYLFASTQPAEVDEETGKRTYRRIHWERFDPETNFHAQYGFPAPRAPGAQEVHLP